MPEILSIYMYLHVHVVFADLDDYQGDPNPNPHPRQENFQIDFKIPILKLLKIHVTTI